MREHLGLPLLLLVAVVAVVAASPLSSSITFAGAGTGHASVPSVGTVSCGDPSRSAGITADGPISGPARFSSQVTYRVTFTERGLPAGTAWSVTLNGVSNRSTSSLITFNEPNGSYSFSPLALISGSSGTRYVAASGGSSFDIDGAGFLHAVLYLVQFELSSSVRPPASGTVVPNLGWYDDGSVVEVGALAAAGYQFVSWQGSGAGNYTGPNDPGNVTVLGPITEVAVFSAAPLNTSSPGSPPWSGTVPMWAFLVTLAFLLLVLIVAVVVALRGRRAPPRRPRPLTPAFVPAPVTPSRTGSAKSEPWRED